MTRLRLSMLSWPEGAKPDTREFDGETAIGRGGDCDWVLPDPLNQLSRRHCLLAPVGDAWHAVDLSLNGTFVNEAGAALGRQQRHELMEGDRLRLGGYVLEARFAAPASLASPMDMPSPFAAADAGPPRSWQVGADWTPPPVAPFGYGAMAGLPAGNGDGFVGPTASDHSAAVSDAWHAPPPGRIEIPEDWDLDEPVAYAQPPPAAVAPPPLPVPARADPPPGATDAALLAAFLRGAGLHDLGTADPAAAMEQVGALVRTAVERLREIQASRSAVKREFRILGTVIRPEGNNPIKFSASTDQAIAALLTGKAPAAQAAADILDDTRLHELAMIAAMRDAVERLLAELAPPLPAKDGRERRGLLSLVRQARGYRLYAALHARTVRAMTDDFDSVFGKAFARAYERVVHNEPEPP